MHYAVCYVRLQREAHIWLIFHFPVLFVATDSIEEPESKRSRTSSFLHAPTGKLVSLFSIAFNKVLLWYFHNHANTQSCTQIELECTCSVLELYIQCGLNRGGISFAVWDAITLPGVQVQCTLQTCCRKLCKGCLLSRRGLLSGKGILPSLYSI